MYCVSPIIKDKEKQEFEKKQRFFSQNDPYYQKTGIKGKKLLAKDYQLPQDTQQGYKDINIQKKVAQDYYGESNLPASQSTVFVREIPDNKQSDNKFLQKVKQKSSQYEIMQMLAKVKREQDININKERNQINHNILQKDINKDFMKQMQEIPQQSNMCSARSAKSQNQIQKQNKKNQKNIFSDKKNEINKNTPLKKQIKNLNQIQSHQNSQQNSQNFIKANTFDQKSIRAYSMEKFQYEITLLDDKNDKLQEKLTQLQLNQQVQNKHINLVQNNYNNNGSSNKGSQKSLFNYQQMAQNHRNYQSPYQVKQYYQINNEQQNKNDSKIINASIEEQIAKNNKSQQNISIVSGNNSKVLLKSQTLNVKNHKLNILGPQNHQKHFQQNFYSNFTKLQQDQNLEAIHAAKMNRILRKQVQQMNFKQEKNIQKKVQYQLSQQQQEKEKQQQEQQNQNQNNQFEINIYNEKNSKEKLILNSSHQNNNQNLDLSPVLNLQQQKYQLQIQQQQLDSGKNNEQQKKLETQSSVEVVESQTYRYNSKITEESQKNVESTERRNKQHLYINTNRSKSHSLQKDENFIPQNINIKGYQRVKSSSRLKLDGQYTKEFAEEQSNISDEFQEKKQLNSPTQQIQQKFQDWLSNNNNQNQVEICEFDIPKKKNYLSQSNQYQLLTHNSKQRVSMVESSNLNNRLMVESKPRASQYVNNNQNANNNQLNIFNNNNNNNNNQFPSFNHLESEANEMNSPSSQQSSNTELLISPSQKFLTRNRMSFNQSYESAMQSSLAQKIPSINQIQDDEPKNKMGQSQIQNQQKKMGASTNQLLKLPQRSIAKKSSMVSQVSFNTANLQTINEEALTPRNTHVALKSKRESKNKKIYLKEAQVYVFEIQEILEKWLCQSQYTDDINIQKSMQSINDKTSVDSNTFKSQERYKNLINNVKNFSQINIDQFLFYISKYMTYVCSKDEVIERQLKFFKINDQIFQSILEIFKDALAEIKDMDSKLKSAFIQQFIYCNDLILPSSLAEKIGGFTVLKKISGLILEKMKNIKIFYDKIIAFNDTDQLKDAIAQNINDLLRNNFDQCEQTLDKCNKTDVYKISTHDILFLKKIMYEVLLSEGIDQNIIYEILEKIEFLRDYALKNQYALQKASDHSFIAQLVSQFKNEELGNEFNKQGFIALSQGLIHYIFGRLTLEEMNKLLDTFQKKTEPSLKMFQKIENSLKNCFQWDYQQKQIKNDKKVLLQIQQNVNYKLFKLKCRMGLDTTLSDYFNNLVIFQKHLESYFNIQLQTKPIPFPYNVKDIYYLEGLILFLKFSTANNQNIFSYQDIDVIFEQMSCKDKYIIDYQLDGLQAALKSMHGINDKKARDYRKYFEKLIYENFMHFNKEKVILQN